MLKGVDVSYMQDFIARSSMADRCIGALSSCIIEDKGGENVKKIMINSLEFKRVEKNLALENLYVNEELALKAIETVNAGKKLTPTMIKEALRHGKV